ncbi:NAD-dependent epimerase/dehydratase family protein [bacterium]|nr:NAD-dependent epimerase/dehydratase family protein [bacterium]
MKILVTGGAGFVGTNLIKRLLKEGHKVISIDNYNTGLESNHQEGCTYLNYDIRNIKDYSPWGDFDVAFHMAAIARIQPSFENPKDYFTVNANGTMNIVEWCSKNNVPLIYAGSSSKHSGKFKNPYTFSKDIGEDIIKLYEEHFNLSSTITRFYNVYGPYQLTEGGYTTLIGRWLYNMENNIQCEVYGDGEQRRDFTHVDDIVEALVNIMDNKVYGYDFELGRGKNVSVNEVAKMMNITPIYKDAKPGEARHTLNTDNTANQILGWNPEINLVDYLKTVIK